MTSRAAGFWEQGHNPPDYAHGPMLTRRSACLMGSAAFAAGAIPLSSTLRAATVRPDIRLAITDRRLPQSLDFSAMLSAHGCATADIVDGLTRLYQDRLLPIWREGTGAVAGLTERAVWECLAEQARSEGRRSLFIGYHAVDEDKRHSVHMVRASHNAVGQAAILQDCGASWPGTAARLALTCQAGRMPPAPYPSPRSSGRAPSTPLNLVSWMIG